ncbi:vegetatible incompatibility het-E-1 [Fusarium pseudoanthophilum]|uniref:Vegetatible incompatibility het-E-1 n=1 Tax=Fusarium pseudoanthophilum TaxID=48495 RepID=A0A8H5V4N9_9HYPO|nr:vegetatible incompatibility het-E-1 [Fusarium pseudoanthophilum]
MSDAMPIQKAVNVGHTEIAQQINNLYDTDGKKDSCLEDLYITNPIADKQRIEDDKGGLLKDCYSWILYNKDFLQWRDDPEQHLLWIRGDPGKGKTMLLAGLITELEEASDDGVFYFFCQATQPLLRTASYVLRGLIWSIVCKRPALISYVRKEYDQAGKGVFSNHNAWQALSRILTAILENRASADFIIIVDALDECTEGREKLIDYISQCSVSCKAKWIISSRNWPDIESQLDGTQSQVRLHLELNHASISNAVLGFVKRKVDQLNSTYDESARVQIRDHLLDNANDTFLWVALVCQELEKPGVNNYHVSNILGRFPAGLNELYARMICDITERDMHWCRAILAVIAVAIRPLSLQELAAADETLTEWVDDKKTLSNLVTSCGSLLTIREHRVYTVHQSVNDFLRNTPKVLPVGIGQQHYSFFSCSMKAMHNRLHRNLYELKDSCVLIDEMDVLPSAPLTIVGYACIYWVDHFCAWLLTENQHPNSLCYDVITKFFETKYLYWLEAMSLLRCTSDAIRAMQRLEDKLKGRASNDLRLLVQDAVQFASTHRAIMDTAPLQLYDSALIFTPQVSKIKGCFSQEISKSIDVLSPDFQYWDACLHTIPGTAGDDICEFSPDGGQIATANYRRIILIDASTGELIKSTDNPEKYLGGFTFHPSGDSLVIFSRDQGLIPKISILRLPNGECSNSFPVDEIGKLDSVSVSPDGQLLALASAMNTVDIWNITTETKIGSCPMNPRSDVEFIAWIHTASHPQALLILGHADVSIWGLDTRHRISKLMSLASMGLDRDAFTLSRDRTCCAVLQGGKEFLLYLWGSSITVQKIGQFDQRRDVRDATWVGDGSVAICGDFGIEIWGIKAKRLIARLQWGPIETIRYGKNRQLASLGNENDTLKIWSLDRILSHSEPTTHQSASVIKRFIISPRGKVAIIRNNGECDILSIGVNGRFLHLPKTLQNSPRRSYYRFESLAFGQDDYFAVPTDRGAIDIFNFDHDKGLYYRERRIGNHLHLAFKHVIDDDLTIQFWGREKIISLSDCVKFWDLKTGKYLRKVSNLIVPTGPTSTITADGRIAGSKPISRKVVMWDIMRGKKTQCFDLKVLRYDPLRVMFVLGISLSSSDILAISVRTKGRTFIALGNAKDGTWIRSYPLHVYPLTLNFLTPKLLDTGVGVLGCDMELGSHNDSSQDSEGGSSKAIPTVDAEDHWDPRYLRLSYSKTEAWLMKGSRRVLWIPRQDVNSPRLFSIHTDLDTGKSTVTPVHDRCLFVLTIKIDSI